MACQFREATGLVLALGLLSGCAGLNELSDGDLLGQSELFGTAGLDTAPARANTGARAQMMPSGAVSANSPIEQGMSAPFEQQTIVQSDPIDAPPPPITAGQDSPDLFIESPASASGPLMLVPPPGETMPTVASSVANQSSRQPSNLMMATGSGSSMVSTAEPPSPFAVQEEIAEETPIIVTSASNAPGMRGREFVPAALSASGPVSDVIRPGEIPLSQDQVNVVTRFMALDELSSMGLLTQEEYTQRRSRNLGAILPYSNEPPAEGLTRQVPSRTAISSRLSALRRSLEMRAITPRQHALERSVILDGLLPSNPVREAMRKPPPSDVIEAAAMLGHLERLRFEGVITDGEFELERRAIDQYLQTGMISTDIATAGSGQTPDGEDSMNGSAQPAPTSSGLGVHLASYRSEEAARNGWGSLERKFRSQLSGLAPVIRRVDLGSGRGTFYRLFAGPVRDSGRANSICQQLKQSDQYCDPLRYDS